MNTLIERCEDAIDTSNIHIVTKGDSADLPERETLKTDHDRDEWLRRFHDKHRPDNSTCHCKKILKKAVKEALASPEVHLPNKLEECYLEAYGKPIQHPTMFCQFESGEENRHKQMRPEFALIDDMMRY